MKNIGTNDLREEFLKFFLRMKSFSLVPKNDKSLLLINAGMAPLKPYFTGLQEPPRRRVTTCQKCIRTGDIENVGKTSRHGTFFEMLGNFSFGDYFKEEIIPWAWEFITEVLQIPKDKLYVTIYLEDDEAFEIWKSKTDVFTGLQEPPRRRVTTCQKCIRTGDIENVGKTSRHGTFFEMLGNFSFGDYFKEEIIPWAWEFITEVLQIPKDKLYVTIYLEDDEAFEIWKSKTDVDPNRIFRLGKDDNFWEIGVGPCGPCTEIHFDRGEGVITNVEDFLKAADEDRVVEFWNLVFTQFDKDEEGNYNRLEHPNIDTGMGLERIATIMQGVDNIFEIDTVKNILAKVSELSGVKYGENSNKDVSLRIITDHVKAVTMLISDGVSPSNEGRGYVLRRLLRRAARHGRLLGIKGIFLKDVVDSVVENYAPAWN